MTAERLAVWLGAGLCGALAWLGATRPIPVPADRLVVVALGVAVALPLAVVTLAWLSSYRTRQRGWT